MLMSIGELLSREHSLEPAAFNMGAKIAPSLCSLPPSAFTNFPNLNDKWFYLSLPVPLIFHEGILESWQLLSIQSEMEE